PGSRPLLNLPLLAPDEVVLVRGRDVPDGARPLGWYQIVATDVPQPTRYFLIEGVIAADEDQERRIVRDGAGYAVAVGDSLFPAAPLEEDTLRGRGCRL